MKDFLCLLGFLSLASTASAQPIIDICDRCSETQRTALAGSKAVFPGHIYEVDIVDRESVTYHQYEVIHEVEPGFSMLSVVEQPRVARWKDPLLQFLEIYAREKARALMPEASINAPVDYSGAEVCMSGAMNRDFIMGFMDRGEYAREWNDAIGDAVRSIIESGTSVGSALRGLGGIRYTVRFADGVSAVFERNVAGVEMAHSGLPMGAATDTRFVPQTCRDDLGRTIPEFESPLSWEPNSQSGTVRFPREDQLDDFFRRARERGVPICREGSCPTSGGQRWVWVCNIINGEKVCEPQLVSWSIY